MASDRGMPLMDELDVLVAVLLKVPVLCLGTIVFERKEVLGCLLAHYVVGDRKETRSAIARESGWLSVDTD